MLNQLSQTPASGLLAAAAGSGENTVVLIAIGVGILFLVLFFVLSRKKQADAIAEEERLRKAKQIRPEELEERKDELSLAELKKAKKSTLGEEQTKEERREMRRKRRAKAQTEKAQSEREVDEGDEEDEELEDDEQLEEPVLVRKAKVEEEPLSDAEAAEIEREKELGKLLDDAVDEHEASGARWDPQGASPETRAHVLGLDAADELLRTAFPDPLDHGPSPGKTRTPAPCRGFRSTAAAEAVADVLQLVAAGAELLRGEAFAAASAVAGVELVGEVTRRARLGRHLGLPEGSERSWSGARRARPIGPRNSPNLSTLEGN